MKLAEILDPTNNNVTYTNKEIYYSVDGDHYYHFASAPTSQDNASLENAARVNLGKHPWKISPATSEEIQIVIIVQSKREVINRELVKHYPGI